MAACPTVKMEAILNQRLFHLLYQTSVTGKLTHLSWTSRILLSLGRALLVRF
uniref:Protein kinase n=1 Tax=Rhizophora mucronata TaxID=61149 RepID=A0A2P2L4F4_RHIMU